MPYTLGLFVEKYHGFTMVSHGRVDPGYRAQMLRFPSEHLTVSVLANNAAYDVEGLARQIADFYLPKSSEILHPPPSRLLHFFGDDRGRIVTFTVTNVRGRQYRIPAIIELILAWR